jgi:HK97 gp10 family phage protein
MTKTTVKVEGLKALQTALQELPKATAQGVMLRVLKKRAQPIADAARQLVPVASGELRNSIVVSTKLTRRQRGQHEKAGPNDVEVFVGPGALPQAHLQEFGTFKEPPQPFMRPAWDRERNGVLEGLKGDLWAEIEKAATRLSSKARQDRS